MNNKIHLQNLHINVFVIILLKIRFYYLKNIWDDIMNTNGKYFVIIILKILTSFLV